MTNKLYAPAGSSCADVQKPDTSSCDLTQEQQEEEMDISLPEEEEEEEHTAVKEEVPEEEMEVETEEVKEQGDAEKEMGCKSSVKIKEENRETDSQKASSVKQKTRERLREGITRLSECVCLLKTLCCVFYECVFYVCVLEYSLEDSDLDGLSDITVSSVHTSDLSSFEGDSDDDSPLSESTEEGEISSEGERVTSDTHHMISH